MHLPSDHESYNRNVYHRSVDKIRYTMSWQGIDKLSLDSWLTNFNGDEERFLAHRILDHLIYRTEDHIFALLQSLFYQAIPSVLFEQKVSFPDCRNNVLGLESNKSSIKLALCSSVDDNTSSAVELARRIKTRFKVDEKNIIDLDKIQEMSDDKIVIIIDDFSGTGKQASQIMTKNIAPDRACKVYFTPLIIHSSAVTKIHADLVENRILDGVCAVEEFTDRYDIFSTESKCFKWGGVSYAMEYKKIYDEIIRSRLSRISKHFKYGIGEQGLIFSFHYRCPNNCIPLIWYSQEGWNPLVRR